MLKVLNINLQKKIFNTFNFFMLLLKAHYSTTQASGPIHRAAGIVVGSHSPESDHKPVDFFGRVSLL